MPNGGATIDDKVNAAKEAPKGGGSIFDSIGKSLEDLVGAVREIPKVVSKAAYYTYYTAKAALGLAAGVAIAGYYGAASSGLGGLPLIKTILAKGYGALILPAGMALGTWLANLKNKVKTKFSQISNELAVGGLLGGLLHHIFVGCDYTRNAVKLAYGTPASLSTGVGLAAAQMPVFLGAHEYLNRALISDYKPKPLSDMGKRIKSMWPIIPPLIANFTVVPEYLGPQYNMPVAAGISLAYGLLKSEPKKKEEKPETYKLPQQYAMPKAA